MKKFAALVFACCFVASLCATKEEIDEYAAGIQDLEESASKWTPPKDASTYTSGMQSQKCSYMRPYDFVIIGGGTSGTVVARRLTEIQQWDVLVLEAGKLETNITRIPAEVNYLAASEYNWGYISEPLTNFKGYQNQRVVVPVGRALGGSSAMNYMLYARGNRHDYDNWVKAGNPGWSYDEVLPYFKKSENESFPNAQAEYHGHSGPMHVEHSHYDNDIARAFIEAQDELGRLIQDYNGETQCAFARAQVNEINGVRQSNADAFWRPVKDRKNLKVLLEAFVLKIMIDKDTKTARAVKFVRNKQCYIVPVSMEVIVSAGTIASPQILMLAGIGKKEHLEQFNIPVVADLPVGDNLWNHICTNFPPFKVDYDYGNSDLRSNIDMYLDHKGLLTCGAGMTGVGFIQNKSENNECVPERQYVSVTVPGKKDTFEYYRNVFGYTKETYDSMVKPLANMSVYSVFSVALYSKTRGTIRLKSNVPTDYPKIDMPYFEDSDEDVETLLGGIRDLQAVAHTSAMQQYNASIVKLVHPECKSYTWDTDEFWKCMIKNMAFVLHHYAGTCKMGSADDPTAIVDTNLKVHGLKNVRVIDASVLPVAMAAHPWTVTTMVAEKASDYIKRRYNV